MSIFDDLLDRIDLERLDRSRRTWASRVGRFVDDVLLLPDSTRRRLEEGDALLESKEFDQAERAFLDVLSQKGDLGRALVGLARARHGLGDLEGALASLEEARERAPDNPGLALLMARFALDAGNYQLAQEGARFAALGLASTADSQPAEFADACATLGWAEWHLGRPDRAVRELRKSLSVLDREPIRIALVSALVDAKQARQAARTAALLTPSELEPKNAMAVGQALLRGDQVESALEFLKVAAERDDQQARLLLVQASLKLGDHKLAADQARHAVARGGGAQALALLGDALQKNASPLEAAEAYLSAAELAREQADASSAMREETHLWSSLALRCVPLPLWPSSRMTSSSAAELQGICDRAMSLVDSDSLLLAAVRSFLPRTPSVELMDATSGKTQDGFPPRVLLALARMALSSGDHERTLELVDSFASQRAEVSESNNEALAESLRRGAHRKAWQGEKEVDLASAIDAVVATAEKWNRAELAIAARRLREDLDRPLLLGVLGEFNAGKSTFVNAFIGTPVAPTGIVPTTATLNVLRSGRERGVRVVYRDGRTTEGSFDDMKETLKSLDAIGGDADGAAVIDQVEIMVPSELLERVWILDSPGSNALDPAHEELAKEAARRADAVLWIFDASQAGKMTETEMHDELRRQGRLIIPVLNKSDRLKDGELERVSKVVEEGFSEPPVPLSAKRALKAKLSGDDDALVKSGLPRLMETLDARVFSRARSLKRSATAGRLLKVLDEALEFEQEKRLELTEAVERAAFIAQCANALRGELLALAPEVARSFRDAMDAATTESAEELAQYINPRLGRIEARSLRQEDRAYLRDVLERSLIAAIEDTEGSALRALEKIFSESSLELNLELLNTTTPDSMAPEFRMAAPLRDAFVELRGFQRGQLFAGALDQELMSLSAGIDVSKQLRPALLRASPPMDAVVLPLLTDAFEGVHLELVRVTTSARQAADVALRGVTSGRISPLRALREVLLDLQRELTPTE